MVHMPYSLEKSYKAPLKVNAYNKSGFKLFIPVFGGSVGAGVGPSRRKKHNVF